MIYLVNSINSRISFDYIFRISFLELKEQAKSSQDCYSCTQNCTNFLEQLSQKSGANVTQVAEAVALYVSLSKMVIKPMKIPIKIFVPFVKFN